jgi:O-antigen ligase
VKNPLVISAKKIAAGVSGVGFFLLFPGFMFYHHLAAMEVIPQFAGGLFGNVAATLFLLFVLLLPFLVKRIIFYSKIYPILVLCFLSFATVWTFTNYMVLEGDYVETAAIQSVETVVLWSALFFVGMALPIESVVLKKFFLISFFLILIFLLYFFINTGSLMFDARRYYSVEDIATYQGFARSALIILLFLIAVIPSAIFRTLLFLGGIFILFFLGARSELYSFLAIAAVLSVIFSSKNIKYSIAILSGFLVIFLVIQFTFEIIASSRQLQVLELSEEASWIGRQRVQEVALDQIAAHPILGVFGGHVAYFGRTGSYAHNVLSAWVNFGLVGFLSYLYLTIVALLVSTKKVILQRNYAPIWVFAFSINFISFLLIVVAKPVFWPIPALGWGLLIKAISSSKNVSNRSITKYHRLVANRYVNKKLPT